MKIDLGSGPYKPDGFLGVDKRRFPGIDVLADLEGTWPFKDNSVEEVRAAHVMEHLPDSVRSMGELYRILIPGGTAFIEVPSTNGMGAFQDPTHRSFWNRNTFLYFDKRSKLGKLYGCAIWEIVQCVEYLQPEMFGPYVRAVVRKPKEEDNDCTRCTADT